MKKNIKKIIYTIASILIVTFSIKTYATTDSFKQNLKYVLKKFEIINIDYDKLEFKNGKLILNNFSIYTLDGYKVGDIGKIKLDLNILLPTRIKQIDIENAIINIEKNNDKLNILNILKKKNKKKKYNRDSLLGNINLKNIDLKFKDKENIKSIENLNGSIKLSFKKTDIYLKNGKEDIQFKFSSQKDIKNNILDLFSTNTYTKANKKSFKLNTKIKDFRVNEIISNIFLDKIGLDIKNTVINANLNIEKTLDNKYFTNGAASISDAILKYKDFDENIYINNTYIDFKDNFLNIDSLVDVNNTKINIFSNYDLNSSLFKIDVDTNNLSFNTINRYRPLKKLNLNGSDISANLKLIFNFKDENKIKDVNASIKNKNFNINKTSLDNLNIDIKTINNKLNLILNDLKLSQDIKGEKLNLTINSNTKINLSNFFIDSKNKIYNKSNLLNLKELDLNINKNKEKIEVDILSNKILGKVILKDNIIGTNLKIKDNLIFKLNGNEFILNATFDKLVYNKLTKDLASGNIKFNLDSKKTKDNTALIFDMNIKDEKYMINSKLLSNEGSLNLIGHTTKEFKHSYNIATKNFDLINYLKELGLINSNIDLTIKDLDINLVGENNLKKIKFDIKSNKDIKLLFKDKQYNIDTNIDNLIYDISTKKIENLSLLSKLQMPNQKYIDNLILNANINDKGMFINSNIDAKDGKLIISGYTDDKLNHKYSIKSKNFDLLKLLTNIGIIKETKDKNDSLKLDILSNIYGNNKDIKGDFLIESDYGSYLLEYEKAKIYGKINDLFNKDIEIDLNFDELWIKYQRFLNVNSNIKINDSSINVLNFGNDKLDVEAVYEFKDKFLNLNAYINAYNLYSTINPDLNILLNEVDMNVIGKINDLKGSITSKKSPILLNGKEFSDLEFKANIENNILTVENINIKNTNISGDYDLNTGIYNINLKSNGENIKELINRADIEFDSNIDVKLYGTFTDSNMVANLNFNNLKYKDYLLSNLSTNINYLDFDAKKIGKTGTLNINRFEVYDKDKEKILSFDDSFNLEDIDINYNIKNKSIDLSKIKYLDKNKFNGIINIDSIFRYSNNEKFGSLVINAKDLKLNNFNINNLSIDLQGTDKGINISEMYLDYENNPLIVEGYLTYPNIDYSLRLIANDFNLKFLEIAHKFKKSNGTVNFNMFIEKNNVEGDIDLKDINIATSDNKIDIKNFNSKVGLNNKTIDLKLIKGSLNSGDFNVKGKFDIPTISDDFVYSKKILLGPIDLDAKIEGVKLYIDDIESKFTSDIYIKDNYILGNILLNETLVKNLPKKKKKKNKINTYFSDLKNEIIKNILNQYYIDVDIETEKNIKVDIPVIAGLVKDIKGDIEAKVKFNMQNSNINVVSDININQGGFELNNHKFILEDTYVKTTGTLDPIIKFKAFTEYQGDEISILMDGKLSDKNIKFSSSAGKTTDEILGLLAFNSTGGLLNFEKFKASNIVGKALESGLNNLLFDNLNNKISSTFGLNEFKIKANFDSAKNSGINDIINNTSTTLYIKNKFFNLDNIFWSTELTVPFDLKSETSKNKLRYDLALSYVLKKGISINTGIRKPINSVDNVLKNNDVALYGGLKYEKQYNYFRSIIEDLSTLFHKREKLKK